MIDYNFSLDDFRKNPLDIDFNFNIGSAITINCMKKLVSRWFDNSLIRWYHIKEIRKILIYDKILEDFTLHLDPSLKLNTYMKDKGELYISIGALLFRSSMTTLKVLCHEISHLWLSQQDFYSKLKVLNKEFKQKYSNHQDVYLMSPIEFYAVVLSVKIMEEISLSLTKERHKKRWNKIVSEERAKIKKLHDLILTL